MDSNFLKNSSLIALSLALSTANASTIFHTYEEPIKAEVVKTPIKTEKTKDIQNEIKKDSIIIRKHERLSETLIKLGRLKDIDFKNEISNDLMINSKRDIEISSLSELKRNYKILNNVDIIITSNKYNKKLPVVISTKNQIKKVKTRKIDNSKIINIKSLDSLLAYIKKNRNSRKVNPVKKKIIDICSGSKNIDIVFLKSHLERITSNRQMESLVRELISAY